MAVEHLYYTETWFDYPVSVHVGRIVYDDDGAILDIYLSPQHYVGARLAILRRSTERNWNERMRQSNSSSSIPI